MIAAVLIALAATFPVTIRVDAGRPRGGLAPIWRFFGGDEPNYAHMKDGRRLLSALGELKPKAVYFRTHNLLTTGDGTPALKWGSTNAYTEDAQGQPVTIWYWEELTLDRPGAKKLAGDLESSTNETLEAEEQERLAREKQQNEIREKRLGEIYDICGDNAECVKKKCAVGYKGANDPDWAALCTERVKEHTSDVIIEQCAGDPGCIKSYCVNKYNNTYPAVSDCVSGINLRKVKNESVKSEETEEVEPQ